MGSDFTFINWILNLPIPDRSQTIPWDFKNLSTTNYIITYTVSLFHLSTTKAKHGGSTDQRRHQQLGAHQSQWQWQGYKIQKSTPATEAQAAETGREFPLFVHLHAFISDLSLSRSSSFFFVE